MHHEGGGEASAEDDEVGEIRAGEEFVFDLVQVEILQPETAQRRPPAAMTLRAVPLEDPAQGLQPVDLHRRMLSP
jgi:D-serine deaminase-like pyridoxal phosphate-dependent protein